MDNENTGLTRSEVEAMIQTAFANHRGSDGKIYATAKDEKEAIAQDNKAEWDASSFVDRGNINLFNRPAVKMPDGKTASVRSMSFNENGQEILVPTVSEDARIMSHQEAIDQYHKTGKYLGKFNSVDEANKYAEQLHQQQASLLKNADEGVLGGGKRVRTMGRDAPMGVVADSNEVAKARAIMGQSTPLGRAHSGVGQGGAKPPASEVEAPLSADVAEAIKKTAEGMSQTFITRAELNAALGGIHPAILNQNRGDQNSMGGVGPMVLTLPLLTSQSDVSAAWEPAGGGAMPFSGFAWVGNKPMITVDPTESGATGFLSVNLDGSGYTWAGSMPTSQPANAWVFDLSQTAGDICIFGNIAPGG
jgi:hypothetical protein